MVALTVKGRLGQLERDGSSWTGLEWNGMSVCVERGSTSLGDWERILGTTWFLNAT